MPILKRLAEAGRAPLSFTLDGRPCQALHGDTVLTAVLTQAERLRESEFSGAPRAGFCMMGACQDCWILTESGARLRACSTFVEPGMRLLSRAPRGEFSPGAPRGESGPGAPRGDAGPAGPAWPAEGAA